jgi:hypothetical protein
MITIKLKNPETMYVDSSEIEQQKITGKGPLVVYLNPFTAKLIANEEVDIADVKINDVIRSGVKIKDIHVSELLKYIGHTGKIISTEQAVKLAEEKYARDSEPIKNIVT